MAKSKHFIIVGRTSEAIARGVLHEFGNGGTNTNGSTMTISAPGSVIQSRIGTFGDGEAIAELFADGKLPDHPIEQNLNDSDKIRVAKSLKGATVSLINSASGLNTSSRALGLLWLIRSLKEDYKVSEIKVIAPALPFLRNDRAFRKTDPDGTTKHQFNAVACKHYARMLFEAGADRVVGFEPHSRAAVGHYQEVFGKRKATFISMGAFFAEALKTDYAPVLGNECQIMVGSPDGLNKEKDYGIARASSFAEAIYNGTIFSACARAKNFRDRPYMFGIHKERIGPNETKIMHFHGNVEGKICVIVDDIISSGGTTVQAAEELKKRGARKVIAIATHAVLVNDALDRLIKSPFIDKLMLTDTIPGVQDKMNGVQDPKLVCSTISPLVNRIIAQDYEPPVKLKKHSKMEERPAAKFTPQVC